jgi:hypothetical protein
MQWHWYNTLELFVFVLTTSSLIRDLDYVATVRQTFEASMCYLYGLEGLILACLSHVGVFGGLCVHLGDGRGNCLSSGG